MTGWNPFFFAGFPQNLFYPPLFSYFTAVLSFLIPLLWAFKAVVLLSLILTPLSIYYCARKFDFSKLKSSVIAMAVIAIMMLPDSLVSRVVLGGMFQATFNVGLVTNALALPIFFFFYLYI